MKKWNQALPTSLLIALFGLSFGANAKEPLKEEDIRWYQVEIILFTQNDEASLSEENWDPESHVEFPQEVQELYLGETSLKELTVEPTPFSTVLGSETSLNGIYRKLSRSSQTEPAIHLSWIQPTRKESPLDNVHIYPGAGAMPYIEESPTESAPLSATIETQESTAYDPGLGFDGLISLKRGHYLHLNIDMGLQERIINSTSQSAFNDDGFYSETAEMPSYSSYRMKQKRRIRSGEIHYFDHPRFGLIAQVTPIELPEPEIIIEEPIKPLKLPIPVDNKSKRTSTQLNPAKKN
jgi:hypothetical protein